MDSYETWTPKLSNFKLFSGLPPFSRWSCSGSLD